MSSVQGISKNQVKLIKSLGIKKYRCKHKLFIAEGRKVLNELFESDFQISQLFVVDESTLKKIGQAVLISTLELKSISQLNSPHYGLALVQMPETIEPVKDDINLVLDGIADPGNLGTIIRLADWYGLKNVYCINNCVDPYSPKVIQASMGSIFRVNVLEKDLESIKWEKNVYGSFLDGSEVSKAKINFPCNLIIGNEANGISGEVEKRCHQKLTIKRYGKAESLNAAIATGILLDRFKQVLS